MCTAAGSAAAIGSAIGPADAWTIVVIIVIAIGVSAVKPTVIVRAAKAIPYERATIVTMASVAVASVAMPSATAHFGYLGCFA
jgi:hypothetical protein